MLLDLFRRSRAHADRRPMEETLYRIPTKDAEGEYAGIKYWPYTGCSPVPVHFTVNAPYVGVCGRITDDEHGLVFIPEGAWRRFDMRGMSFAETLRFAQNHALMNHAPR